MSVVKILRLALIILAGILLGAGGLLLGQVHVARIMEERVDSTFFLFRAIGYATFVFQGDEVQVALAIKELPPEALEHSKRVAWFLIAVGSLGLLAAPFLKRRKRRA
ncbi:MAG: hypothetical protein H6832_13120 [Planctomycetes bacterium]|nr:hypothetical protein [Planctomycetota bacterium]